MRRTSFALITAVAILFAASAFAEDPKLIRIEHKVREIEGWKVHVDESLLKGKHQETGKLILKILGERLHEIALRLPAEPVKRMREVPISIVRRLTSASLTPPQVTNSSLFKLCLLTSKRPARSSALRARK